MAIIYGHPDSEKRFLKKLPDEVETIGDISRVHQKMQNDFDSIEDNGIRMILLRIMESETSSTVGRKKDR